MSSSRHRGWPPAAVAFAAALARSAAAGAPGAAPDAGFVANAGQAGTEVLLEGRLAGHPVYFTARGLVVVLRAPEPGAGAAPAPPGRDRERGRPARGGAVAVKIAFESARMPAAIAGRVPTATRSHFLLGRDPAAWRAGVPSYREVLYREVWPGIDLVFRTAGRGLAWSAMIGPGGDPARIRWRYEGARSIGHLDDEDVIDTAGGRLVHRLDATAGLLELDSGPAPAATASERGLRWSSFLGGARDDIAYAVAVGGDGTVYVAGATRSDPFPTTVGVLDSSYGGSYDAFVTALAPDGASALWSTYLGSSGDERAWALRLDGNGRPVVAGITASAAFPTTAGAYDPSHNGLYDAYVAVLETDGSGLAWSTFLGGTAEEWDVSGLALDATGRVALAGSTRSADFPVAGTGHDAALGGVEDAFVAVLEADGSALALATYLGGAERDIAEDIAFDATGRPIVVGRTYSPDFAVTPGAFRTSFSGGTGQQDGFVAALAAGEAGLAFASFLGGHDDDTPYAVALAADGAIVVAGSTQSPDFPVTPGAHASAALGAEDGFVTIAAPDGASLLASTYLGASSLDRTLDVALDARARPIVAGWTCSADHPVPGHPWDSTFNGPCDAELAILSDDLSALLYATYLGGDDDETAFALALDARDRPYVVGDTRSDDFPATAGAYDTSHNSAYTYFDAFVTALWPIPDYCTAVGGSPPQLHVDKSGGDPCPAPAPAGLAVDLIEGAVANLSPADIGPVVTVACGADDVVFPSAMSPPPAGALFHLARHAGGAYTDGGGATLVGGRVPTAGDCPP